MPDRLHSTLGRTNERCPGCGGDPGDNWFDRSLCACGVMHQRCRHCGFADDCPYDNPPARPVVSPPDSTEAERVAEIQARADKALPGPWEWNPSIAADEPCMFLEARGRDYRHVLKLTWPELLADSDAEFIAHAREDIPYLLGLLVASPPSPQLIETLREAQARCRAFDRVICGWIDQGELDDELLPELDAALASVAVGQPENTEPT